MEHAPNDLTSILHQLQASQPACAEAVVRVPSPDNAALVKQLLDMVALRTRPTQHCLGLHATWWRCALVQPSTALDRMPHGGAAPSSNPALPLTPCHGM